MQENNIFPFLWMRGESEEVIRTEMEKISESNIRAVCLEARPHPDFAGEGWWHDVDIVLDEAKKRGMKIWILDDAHFPTGQANGLLPEKYPERARRYLYTQFVETTGPLPCAQVDVELLTKKQFTWMDFGKPQVKPVLDEKRVLSVTAYRVIEGDVLSEEGTDLTGKVKDGILTWDVPEGTWRIFVNSMTTDFGARPEYINYIDEDSVRVLIESVYEAHYKHYKDEFGKTILGFFSDEPGFYNTDDLKMDDKIGEKMMPLPWCGELEEKMETVCGAGWKEKIPYLWYKDEGGKCAALRFHYMDCVSRLYEKNFSRQIGEWCRSHGVQYIGHVIEDNGQHTRLGCGAGHYFRAMAGQDMAGIDNIGNQIVPGNPDSTRHNPSGAGDPQFFHFGLAKLGASEAWIDPKKKGRLMCENFGAYGWGLGIKNMKWLVDYLVAQGVNRFVPHAFSMADYPDDDCPPHYYARGNNPQFPFFGELMKYTDRLCGIFSEGQNVPQAAVLYEAEGDWAGKAMRSYVPGRELQEHQIDYEILPVDVFEDVEYYGTRVEDGNLIVNGRVMKVLIIPEMEYLSEKVFRFLSENPDLTTVFINSRPKEVIGAGEAREIGLLLGQDLGVFFCFCAGRQIPRLLSGDIHVPVDQRQQIVAIRAGGITQVDNRDIVPIALLGDGSVIPGKVALAVQRQPAHAAGTGIFQIGIEEIGCLADAGSADHEAVDIVAVHQSGKLALLALAPQHQPLLRGAVVAAAPVPDPERDMGIDLFDLLCGGPPRGTVLSVAHRPGLDAAQGVAVGQRSKSSDDKKHSGAGQNQESHL